MLPFAQVEKHTRPPPRRFMALSPREPTDALIEKAIFDYCTRDTLQRAEQIFPAHRKKVRRLGYSPPEIESIISADRGEKLFEFPS